MKEIKKITEEMQLYRDNEDQFYRIFRKSFDGKNANTETYGRRLDYKGNEVTTGYFVRMLEQLKDPVYRFAPKNDRDKTNITDAPGFGSVRLSPPYESPSFDREFDEFIGNIIDENDTVIDFGGGFSPFLAMLPRGKKKIVDKTGIEDIYKEVGIEYEEPETWMAKPIEKNTVVFCWHTLEHVDNPEEIIEKLSTADIFMFATPNEEAIDTSIYHNIFMQVEIFKKIFKRNKKIAFMRTGRGLDIHGIVINNAQKWNYIKNNFFFNKNFKFYSELQ